MQPFTSSILARLAKEMGYSVILESNFTQAGRIEFKSGKSCFFKLATLDCNGSAAAKIATDKDYASNFMKSLGFNVPVGKAFFSDEWCVANNTCNNKKAAIAYAHELGYPVIIKPNSKAQGNGVNKIYNETELTTTLEDLFLIDNIVLIQKIVPGRDYRFIVYADSNPIVYERVPFSVIGNDKDTIFELADNRIKGIRLSGRHIAIEPTDPRIKKRVSEVYNIQLSTIPKSGEKLQLLDNANMSCGGESIDLSNHVHESWRRLAINVSRKMNLKLCGIDIMTEGDLRKELSSYTVIEINDHPGLEHYSSMGEVQLERVENLYRKVIRDLDA
ncbi:MAG: ATP-grasp domain-containing protein [Candidatus Vogelbacteria bacterium]|nr:ATP-grasp domain-containing protein [Candidatus Vogelbacteria bacterium]